MGLNERLSRMAARRAHVLIVEVPGAWVIRLHLEGALRERGWRMALSPAEADVMAVCGRPGPQMRDVIDHLWAHMPGPRVRVDLVDMSAADALDVAGERLLDVDTHYQDARSRLLEPEMNPSSGGHGDMDHGGMGHGDMEMAPGGIPLAEGQEDRDGLEMDVLHLPLGPVLPHWPAGLVLHCTLQGDVITEAQGHLVDAPTGPTSGSPATSSQHGNLTYPPAESRAPAWRWDNIARLLALAGWDDAAARCRLIRDECLTNGHGRVDEAAPQQLRRHITRSRALRWSLRGLGRLDVQGLEDRGLPRHLAGDTYDRLVGMLDRAVNGEGADPAATGSGEQGTTMTSPEAVAAAVVGLELAAARLVVAGLDLPPLSRATEVSHA